MNSSTKASGVDKLVAPTDPGLDSSGLRTVAPVMASQKRNPGAHLQHEEQQQEPKRHAASPPPPRPPPVEATRTTTTTSAAASATATAAATGRSSMPKPTETVRTRKKKKALVEGESELASTAKKGAKDDDAPSQSADESAKRMAGRRAHSKRPVHQRHGSAGNPVQPRRKVGRTDNASRTGKRKAGGRKHKATKTASPQVNGDSSQKDTEAPKELPHFSLRQEEPAQRAVCATSIAGKRSSSCSKLNSQAGTQGPAPPRLQWHPQQPDTAAFGGSVSSLAVTGTVNDGSSGGPKSADVSTRHQRLFESPITQRITRSPNTQRGIRSGESSLLLRSNSHSLPDATPSLAVQLFQSRISDMSDPPHRETRAPAKSSALSALECKPLAVHQQQQTRVHEEVNKTRSQKEDEAHPRDPVVKKMPPHLLKRMNSYSTPPQQQRAQGVEQTTPGFLTARSIPTTSPSLELPVQQQLQEQPRQQPQQRLGGGRQASPSGVPTSSPSTPKNRVVSSGSNLELSTSVPRLQLQHISSGSPPRTQPGVSDANGRDTSAAGHRATSSTAAEAPSAKSRSLPHPSSGAVTRAVGSTKHTDANSFARMLTPPPPPPPPPAPLQPVSPAVSSLAGGAASPVASTPKPIAVHGALYHFALPRAMWVTEAVQFTIANAVRPAGRDDMFLYYAGEGKLPGAARTEPITVKVFRPDVMGVTAEADYFALMECQTVAEYVARAWDGRMAKSSFAATDRDGGGLSSLPGSSGLAPYALMSVQPFLQTGRRLVRLEPVSVEDGLAQCSHPTADPTGDFSLFARTTADTDALLCIVERGSFHSFTPVSALASTAHAAAAPPQMTPRGTQLILKPRPGATPRAATTPRENTTSTTPPISSSPQEMDGQKLTKLASALAHLSYAESEGSLVLTGLREGCCRCPPLPPAAGGGTLQPVLTDPLVHSALKLPTTRRGGPRTAFGRTNGGSRLVESWRRTHVCNEYCGLLSLTRPLPPSASKSLGGGAAQRKLSDAALPPSVGLPAALETRHRREEGCGTDRPGMLACLTRMRERLPLRAPNSAPGSTVTSPKKSRTTSAIFEAHHHHGGHSAAAVGAAAVSPTLNFCGGILYCFDREGSARWQPSKVTVRLNLSQRPTAPPPTAKGTEAKLVSFHAYVRSEDTDRSEGTSRERAGMPSRKFVPMRVKVFALSLEPKERTDEAYFTAAGERTLLAEVLSEYNNYLRHERSRAAKTTTLPPQPPLSCRPCAVIRINRNKVRATLAANPGADDGSSQNIIDFFSADSKDMMLIAEPEDDDEAVALIESNYAKQPGPATTATTATTTTVAVAELCQPQMQSETKRLLQAFCAEEVGGGLLSVKDLALAVPPSSSTTEKNDGRRKAAPTAASRAATLLGYLVSASSVKVNTAAASVSSLGDRVLFLEERLSQFHVYTALKYAFNFYKLKWQPIETFICVPHPEKGIGVGTYRVCFEVLELPRRRRLPPKYTEGYNIQREMALGSAHGPNPASFTGANASTNGSAASVPLASDEHSPFASPSMPKLDNGTTPSSSPLPAGNTASTGPHYCGAGPLPSQTGVWTANVAKMFKRNAAASAGLPITEHNYFFEGAKQNFCACVARDFNQTLAMRGGGGHGQAPQEVNGSTPSSHAEPGALLMTSRTVKHMNRGQGSLDSAAAAAASPRQWQYSSTGNSTFPQLWFIPESVVTLRYDVDLPLHLCHARRGFFSYRCTEIRKHKHELFEEACGVVLSPMTSPSSSPSHVPQGPTSKVPSIAHVRKAAAPGGNVSSHVQCMTFTIEPQLDGQFSKYTSNDERVFYSNEVPLNAQQDHIRRQVVKCAEALAHFSWEKSSGGLLLCDLQGVGTALTDPEIHTVDDGEDDDEDAETLAATYDKMLTFDGMVSDREDSCCLFEQTAIYLGGNGGRAGIELFLQRHKCNEACEAAGLTPLRGTVSVARKCPPTISANTAPSVGSVATRRQQLQQDQARNRYILVHKGTLMAAQML